jgi:serine/threonine protein kinase
MQQGIRGQIDEYEIMGLLGSGYSSEVRLGRNTLTEKLYAIKTVAANDEMEENKRSIETESAILKGIGHPHIIKLHQESKRSEYVALCGKSTPVLYEVLQLAAGGELCDYIFTGGEFPERIVRFYFHQLIEALDHLHSKGFAHRDLKPQNLLLDENFNLLLADFGFSGEFKGRDGSGAMKTPLGTPGFMAPEIYMKITYSGIKVDLFAASVILFLSYTGTLPFDQACMTDSFYKIIYEKDYKKFWKFKERKRPPGYFSEQFKDLMNSMFSADPEERLCISGIRNHAWFLEEKASSQEVMDEFSKRKDEVKELVDARTKRKEEPPKEEICEGKSGKNHRPEVKFRGGAIEEAHHLETVIDDNHDLSSMLKSLDAEKQAPEIEPYLLARITNYYSSWNSNELLRLLATLCGKLLNNVEVSPDGFVVKAMAAGRIHPVHLEMRVFSVGKCSAVVFNRAGGDCVEYHGEVKRVSACLGQHEV